MVVSVRDGVAGNGDEVGLLLPRECVAIADLASVAHNRIHPAVREASADRHNRGAAHVERAAHLGQAPALAQFEQDLGASARTGAFLTKPLAIRLLPFRVGSTVFFASLSFRSVRAPAE